MSLGLHLVFEMPIGTFSTYLVNLVQGRPVKPRLTVKDDDKNQTTMTPFFIGHTGLWYKF